MKKVKIFALLVISIFLFGCAEVGPRMISGKVYKKSEESVITEKDARIERLKSDKQGQELAQKRAAARNEVAMAELGEALLTVTGGTPAVSGEEQPAEEKATSGKESSAKKGAASSGEKPPSKVPTASGKKPSPVVMTAEGVIGGFPVIFINDSEMNKELVFTKVGGDFDGYKWRFYLTKKGGQKKYKLETGEYAYQWTTEYSSEFYPPKPKIFKVTTYPHYWDDRSGENFHGGVRLFGY